jgi:hypothetical protein
VPYDAAAASAAAAAAAAGQDGGEPQRELVGELGELRRRPGGQRQDIGTGHRQCGFVTPGAWALRRLDSARRCIAAIHQLRHHRLLSQHHAQVMAQCWLHRLPDAAAPCRPQITACASCIPLGASSSELLTCTPASSADVDPPAGPIMCHGSL